MYILYSKILLFINPLTSLLTMIILCVCVCVRVHECHLLSGVTLFGSFFILMFVIQHTVEGF